MEVIQSFTIDHTRLKPGIYVSRQDKGFTTFDLRITEPNREPAVAPAAMHSMEHLMATWFRNSSAKNDVVYVGPMGCLTGMYIVMTGDYTVEDMRQLPTPRPTHVPVGMPPLPQPPAQRFPLRVHTVADNPGRRESLCRRIRKMTKSKIFHLLLE